MRKRFLRWLLLCSLALALVPAVGHAQQTSHKVLILDEGDFTRPFFVGHAFAIRQELTKSANWRVEVDIEMLDIDRYPDDDHRKKLLKLLGDKHRQRPPEVIVAQGERAVSFADQLRSALLIDVPIVFTATGNGISAQLPPRTTGIRLKTRVIDQANLARQLLPDTTHIAVIGNTTLPGTYPIQSFREFADIARDIKVIDLIDLPIPQLFDRVASLPQQTVICYFGVPADLNGRVFLPHEALTTIMQLANRPVFVPTPNLIGFGATGGIMIAPQDGTREVAALVRRAIAGEAIGSLAPIAIDTRKAVFDARELAKWNIPVSRLPPNSELMFYEVPLWERYWREALAIATAFLIQTILIVMLAVEYRRRRRAELEFRRSMSDLAYLNRGTALGELSASIAHELNQPLAAILSNAEAAEAMLDTDPPAMAELKLALADIRRDDQRASDIIRSMRSLYSKAQFHAQPVDLNVVVREMLAFVAWEARTKSVSITVDLERGLPPLMADRVQLDQVVLNLLMNAIESAASAEQEKRWVRVTTQREGTGAVEVAIEDSGPGIPKDAMARIFDPHYTTKEQGMGMGLSISRTIIEAHGSRLNVCNTESAGARFWFVLQEAAA